MQLSVLIPGKNEEFMGLTVKNLLENIEAETEIICVLDGYETEIPEIPDDPRVKIIKLDESIGQRAATNLAAREAQGTYIMKIDAHCAVDKGFDRKMLEAFAELDDKVTMIPLMKNLHAFDWVCPEGHRRYQSPSGPCEVCGKETKKDIIWKPRHNTPNSTAYRFDRTLHFQYFNEYKEKQIGDLVETMSAQGSCFMITKKRYFELDICEEAFGSWGQQGTEVALKTWLSGGRLIVNKRTWYAHMFRTQGGDFGFPYKQDNRQVEHAREYSRDLFMKDKWPKAIRPFKWVVEKFQPPEFEDMRKEKKITKGILYYTNNKLNMKMARTVREAIKWNAPGIPITSVSLKPLDFGNNIVFGGFSGYKTMYQQILTGLKTMKEDVVYFCEHDVLYHPDHFKYIPPTDQTWGYNGNYWMIRWKDGFAIHYDVSPLSGLVVYRKSAIKHFEERLAMIEDKGFGYYMGFEPFTHGRIKWKYWCPFEVFMPENANIDLETGGNLTNKRWSQDRFIKKPKFWLEADYKTIPGWDNLPNIIKRFNPNL
jgi:glycosyltransferase involved in cell wall biosynthesis